MPENHDTDHTKKPADQKKKANADERDDIIELSDIAIGTSQEDDVIIELTEELIGEAMNGITGVTHEAFIEGEHILDLSHDSGKDAASFDMPDVSARNHGVSHDNGFSDSIDIDYKEVEDHLEKKLDDFFGMEQDDSSKPAPTRRGPSDDGGRKTAAVPEDSELLAALEVMIRNKYGDRIHHMIVAVIDKIVSEELKRIKKNIIESVKS